MNTSAVMTPVSGAPWMLDVAYNGFSRRIEVVPVAPRQVVHERHEMLPVFSPQAPEWAQGERLRELRAFECSAYGALVADSLALVNEAGKALVAGKDYAVNPAWGTIGRLADGVIGPQTRVYASYVYYPSRLDSLVLGPTGKLAIRQGQEGVGVCCEPPLKRGEKRLGNLYFSGRVEALSDAMLFPVLSCGFPNSPDAGCAPALLPNTVRKLRAGQNVKILAWGDSVTEASYLPPGQRYQAIFARALRKHYPSSHIEMRTQGWGGRTTASFFNEPPGSPHNYAEKVLAAQPDLVISEFVNDAGLAPEVYQANYQCILADFRARQIEWIIITPHYILPAWMPLSKQKNIDDDPRGYARFLRCFARTNHVALADGSRRYGHLWRQGIPYMVYMTNGINHPDQRGMKLFADALIELFLSRPQGAR